MEFTDEASVFSVLDIGGGSTEVVTGTVAAVTAKHSFDIGCVRLTERFLRSSPPTVKEIDDARRFIESTFIPVPSLGISGTYAVAVAGTVTTMAAIHQQLPAYDPKKVTGFVLDRPIVSEIFDMLKVMTSDEISALPQVSAGRADIILAGILIVEAFLKVAEIPAVVVSDRGLRYGIVLRELDAARPRSVQQ